MIAHGAAIIGTLDVGAVALIVIYRDLNYYRAKIANALKRH